MTDQGLVRLASVVVLVKGILSTLLGVVHIVVAFAYEAGKIAGQGTAEMRRDYLLWFYGVGLFIVFMGLVDIACHRGLAARMCWAWRLSFLCAVFTTVLGVSGVAVFGASPPLLLLVTGLIGLVTLAGSKRRFCES
ncbi:MAG: hypothetical protein LJF15_20305 [Acidobacteria bacterium]|jgi:hypothetical protein|nr:hypothetical protein [Acidobacteriota bacterium]